MSSRSAVGLELRQGWASWVVSSVLEPCSVEASGRAELTLTPAILLTLSSDRHLAFLKFS